MSFLSVTLICVLMPLSMLQIGLLWNIYLIGLVEWIVFFQNPIFSCLLLKYFKTEQENKLKIFLLLQSACTYFRAWNTPSIHLHLPEFCFWNSFLNILWSLTYASKLKCLENFLGTPMWPYKQLNLGNILYCSNGPYHLLSKQISGNINCFFFSKVFMSFEMTILCQLASVAGSDGHISLIFLFLLPVC